MDFESAFCGVDGSVCQAARVFHKCLGVTDEQAWFPVLSKQTQGCAHADARANVSQLWGWWCPVSPTFPTHVTLVHIFLKLDDFPSSWEVGILQQIVSTLELFAQTALVVGMPSCRNTI